MALAGSPDHLLVVDDSADTRELLQRKLSSLGYRVDAAPDVDSAVALLERVRTDLVITDLKMPGKSGLELVRYARSTWPDTRVIVITGYPSMEWAAGAIEAGAEELLAKPFTYDELLSVVRRVLERRRPGQSGRSSPGSRLASLGIVGRSPAVVEAVEAVPHLAAVSIPLLLVGERGTGKQRLARAIHLESSRAAAPFLVIACDAVPGGPLLSHLFGRAIDDGADGSRVRDGAVGLAQDGTLYLEDVDSIPVADLQALLVALEGGEFYPVATTKARAFGCRLILASHHDLLNSGSRGSPTGELLLRLGLRNVALPPLRERGADTDVLAAHFLQQACLSLGHPSRRFSQGALEALAAHHWPGNLDEMRDRVFDIAANASSPVIDASDLPAALTAPPRPGVDVSLSLQAVETEHIHRVLESVGGNKSRAAAILGINRKTLRAKLQPGTPPPSEG